MVINGDQNGLIDQVTNLMKYLETLAKEIPNHPDL